MAIKLWNLGQKTEEGAYKELTSVVLDDFNVANFNVGSTIISADKPIEVDPSKAEEQVDELVERVDAIAGSEADLPVNDWCIQLMDQQTGESEIVSEEFSFPLNTNWLRNTLGFDSTYFTTYISSGSIEIELDTTYNVLTKTINVDSQHSGVFIKLPINFLDIMAQYETKKISKNDFINAVKDKCLYMNIETFPCSNEYIISLYKNLKLSPISNPVYFYENEQRCKYSIKYEATVLHGVKIYFTLYIATWFDSGDSTNMRVWVRLQNNSVLLPFRLDHFDRYFNPK